MTENSAWTSTIRFNIPLQCYFKGKANTTTFSFGIGRTSNLESFTCSLDLKVSTLLLWKKEIPMCANTDPLLCSCTVWVAGVKRSRRKGPTKMQQALNAGNVHSKRTVSKPLILSVIEASFQLLADPRLWWWSLSNALCSWLFVTGNLLVVTFWRTNYEFQAVAHLRIFGSTCSRLIIKICWMALLHYCIINLYAHVKEAEKKFLGNVSIFFIF